MINARLPKHVAAAIVAASVSACATAPSQERNLDPFEKVNRVIYRVNDIGDRYVARPMAKGYQAATPQAFRAGMSNLFSNLSYPITVVNDVLQGKFRQGGEDLARFLINSTVGLGGLFDPASTIGLPENDEDFGQTLVRWGLPEGPYLMVPVFGPYTVSSGAGDLAGAPLNLLNTLPDSDEVLPITAGYLIHRRAGLLGADETVQQAFDPYIFIRDAYLQNRRYKIYDGDVPEDELDLEEDFEDEEALEN